MTGGFGVLLVRGRGGRVHRETAFGHGIEGGFEIAAAVAYGARDSDIGKPPLDAPGVELARPDAKKLAGLEFRHERFRVMLGRSLHFHATSRVSTGGKSDPEGKFVAQRLVEEGTADLAARSGSGAGGVGVREDIFGKSDGTPPAVVLPQRNFGTSARNLRFYGAATKNRFLFGPFDLLAKGRRCIRFSDEKKRANMALWGQIRRLPELRRRHWDDSLVHASRQFTP
jgi:hypothetical protein